MCGICGKIEWGVPSDLESDVLRMMDRMVHRGPDDRGIHVAEYNTLRVGLGHQRLSILDLSVAGKQPMADKDRRAWIVYNGEVYNYRELRKELESSGHHFQSGTDTEVVLKAYQEWGVESLDRLEGMFAFAIWDAVDRVLFLARDRAGIKPLHYSLTPTGLAFSSEIKSLLALPEIKADVDPSTIDEFLTLGYISAPRTAFHGIQKLPPGHYARWEGGKFECVRYWTHSYCPSVEESEWKEAFVDVFSQAVERQMVSDVPLGGFLSGGIDSSLVVWMMSRAASTPVQTFSLGFGDVKSDETRYAEEVARSFSTDHTSNLVSHDAMELLPSLVKQLDEPFADSSIIPLYLVSLETQKSVKVALSGDGGDELFAGYTNYIGERVLGWLNVLPSPVMRALAGGARLGSRSGNRLLGRLDNVLSTRDLKLYQRYLEKAAICKTGVKSGLYTPEFQAATENGNWKERVEALLDEQASSDPVEELGCLDFQYYLPNDMLTKVDRMSMLCSLEVRVPFLDERVVDFAARVPSSVKLRGLTTKHLLREALSTVLPRRITHRKKQGFELPVDSWFSGRFCDYADSILRDRSAKSRSYLDPVAVDRILLDHRSGVRNQGRLIFAMVCLELWFQQVVDQRGA